MFIIRIIGSGRLHDQESLGIGLGRCVQDYPGFRGVSMEPNNLTKLPSPALSASGAADRLQRIDRDCDMIDIWSVCSALEAVWS